MDKDKIWKARNVNLPNYFKNKGFELKKIGDRYKVINNSFGGLYLQNCTYFWFSEDKGGNSIDCLMNVFNLDFSAAVNELVGTSLLDLSISKKPLKKEKLKEFEFDNLILSKNNSKVVKYLENRGIDKRLISLFLEKGKIFQDTNENVVFPLYFGKEITGVELVGTRKRWKHIESNNSLAHFNFEFLDLTKDNDIEFIIIFESTIDLMSFLCMKISLEYISNSLFVSMSGLKPSIVNYYHETFQQAKIILAVDNDQYAEKFCNRLNFNFKRLVPPNDYNIKDWNDLIAKQKKGVIL